MTPWGPGAIELGENAGLTLDEIRAQQLRGYKPRVATPVMPEVDPGRPDINTLYNRMATLQGTPIDYSKLRDVGLSREAAAKRDLGVGMALQALGGSTMAPAGGHILTQALEAGKPLRANAADVGYMDPTTGEFVENPMAKRTRDERVIASRIDALTREQEAKARIAESQNRTADAQTAKQNAEALRLLALSIAQQNANTAKTKAEKPAVRKPVAGMVTQEGGPVYHDPEKEAFVGKGGEEITNAISVGEHQKRENDLRVGAETAAVAKSLIKQVDDNPGAFTMSAGIASSLPETLGLQARATKMAMSSKEQIARAAVMRDAYNSIHQLTGAVLSMGESKRMAPFIAGPNELPETLIPKLRGALQLYETVLKERQASGYGGRPKPPAAPAAPAAPAVSDEDLLKLYAPKAP